MLVAELLIQVSMLRLRCAMCVALLEQALNAGFEPRLVDLLHRRSTNGCRMTSVLMRWCTWACTALLSGAGLSVPSTQIMTTSKNAFKLELADLLAVM